MNCHRCGESVPDGNAFCSRCGKPVPPPSGEPANHGSWASGWKVAVAVVALLVVVGVLAVAGTRDECVRRRQAIGAGSYYAEMLGGASGADVQSSLSHRVKCPLGVAYSDDLVCPIHGSLTPADVRQVYQNTRGVYGY